MKEKIKRVLRIITTIIALLWVFGEIAFKSSWENPNLVVIIGILVMWYILTRSLEKTEEAPDRIITEKNFRFCHNCGFEIKENTRFCTECGEQIKI